MIIVRAMANNDVGFPFADEAGQKTAVLERGRGFTIVKVEHFGGDAEDSGSFLHFGSSSLGQGAAGLAPVADIPIRDGHKLDFVPTRGPQSGGATRLQLAIIRVRSKTDNA